MNKTIKKSSFFEKIIPFGAIYIIIRLALRIFKKDLEAHNFDVDFIIAANLLIFLLTIIALWMQARGASSTNVNAFLRGIYSSLLMKMFVVVGALFIYIAATGGTVNQNAVLSSLGIYIIYTAVEVIILTKIVRKKPDA
ncbi:MAG: hypothetical protein ABI208_09185 [Ginsengibacter sp.]|jgi:hypothetical protein